MISFRNITKVFDSDIFTKSFTVLNDLSFTINESAITGFLGANGAGKTTSIKILMDFIRPTSGEIIFSEQVGKDHFNFLKNVGYLPERPYFYPHLTGTEFLNYMGQLQGLSTKASAQVYHKWAEQLNISFALDRKLNKYSKGMLQRIGFISTIIHEPKLIILDEPLSGLDPIGRKQMKDAMLEVAKEGKSIFFSSHIIGDVEEISNHIIFLKEGTLAYEGSLHDLMASQITIDYRISYIKNGENHLEIIPAAQKEQKLSELIASGAEINSLVQNQKSLEEVIYETRSE